MKLNANPFIFYSEPEAYGACGFVYEAGAFEYRYYKDVGNLFPCSFAVYEDDNRVFVSQASTMKIAAEIGLAPANKKEPVIKKTGEEVHAAWERF